MKPKGWGGPCRWGHTVLTRDELGHVYFLEVPDGVKISFTVDLTAALIRERKRYENNVVLRCSFEASKIFEQVLHNTFRPDKLDGKIYFRSFAIVRFAHAIHKKAKHDAYDRYIHNRVKKSKWPGYQHSRWLLRDVESFL